MFFIANAGFFLFLLLLGTTLATDSGGQSGQGQGSDAPSTTVNNDAGRQWAASSTPQKARKPHRRWTAADYSNAVSMRERGVRYKEIISATGIPKSTLLLHMSSSGVEKANRQTTDEEKQMIHDKVDEGKPAKQIHQEMMSGVNLTTIHNIMAKYKKTDEYNEKTRLKKQKVNTTHMVAPSSANHSAPGSAQMFPPSMVPQTPQIPYMSQSQIDAMMQDLVDMEEVSSSRQAGTRAQVSPETIQASSQTLSSPIAASIKSFLSKRSSNLKNKGANSSRHLESAQISALNHPPSTTHYLPTTGGPSLNLSEQNLSQIMQISNARRLQPVSGTSISGQQGYGRAMPTQQMVAEPSSRHPTPPSHLLGNRDGLMRQQPLQTASGVVVTSTYQLAPLPPSVHLAQSSPPRQLQTSAQPVVDPFGHLDLGTTIDYAEQASSRRNLLLNERDQLMHSITEINEVGEYSSRLLQIENLDQQINSTNVIIESLIARAEQLSQRNAGPSYRQNIASTYAYGQSSQQNTGQMAQQFPSGQNIQAMPSNQVYQSPQLYNPPNDAGPSYRQNIASTYAYGQSSQQNTGQMAHQQFPSGQNTQTMPSSQVHQSQQLYNLPSASRHGNYSGQSAGVSIHGAGGLVPQSNVVGSPSDQWRNADQSGINRASMGQQSFNLQQPSNRAHASFSIASGNQSTMIRAPSMLRGPSGQHSAGSSGQIGRTPPSERQ